MNALAIITFLSFFFSSPAHAAQAPEPAWEPEPALHDTPMVVKTQPSASGAFAKTWTATSLGLLACAGATVAWTYSLIWVHDDAFLWWAPTSALVLSAGYIVLPSWLAHKANGGEWWPQLIGSAVGWGTIVAFGVAGAAFGAVAGGLTLVGGEGFGTGFNIVLFGSMAVGTVAASFGPIVGYRLRERAKSNNPEPKKASWGVTPMYTGERFVPALAVTGRFG